MIRFVFGLLLIGTLSGWASTDMAICAKGKPRMGFDKARYGDFELVLRMPRTTFKYGQPVPVQLIFRNTGPKTITLAGIIPYRQSTNPPVIEIKVPGGRRLSSSGDGVRKNLLSVESIVIAAGEELILVDTDLASLMDFPPLPGAPPPSRIFRVNLPKGCYRVLGRFDPWPQDYWCSTEEIKFKIK